jgi:hypothetical protein
MAFTGFYLAIAGILIAGSGGLASIVNFGISIKKSSSPFPGHIVAMIITTIGSITLLTGLVVAAMDALTFYG